VATPTLLIIALGLVVWGAAIALLARIIGGAFNLGSDTDEERRREFAKKGEDWC
jgi:hypothetical protein